jgi:hypothetical protein
MYYRIIGTVIDCWERHISVIGEDFADVTEEELA